jgi:hypothetical protein
MHVKRFPFCTLASLRIQMQLCALLVFELYLDRKFALKRAHPRSLTPACHNGAGTPHAGQLLTIVLYLLKQFSPIPSISLTPFAVLPCCICLKSTQANMVSTLPTLCKDEDTQACIASSRVTRTSPFVISLGACAARM